MPRRKYQRTLRTGLDNTGKEARKNKKNIMLGDVLDKNVNREGLSKSDKDKVRDSARQAYYTEKRKGGKASETRATARAGRVASLTSSGRAAMTELANKEALKKSATKKKKEDNSPAAFNMLVNGRMKQKAEADSGTTFNDKDQKKMGVFNYGMSKE